MPTKFSEQTPDRKDGILYINITSRQLTKQKKYKKNEHIFQQRNIKSLEKSPSLTHRQPDLI